MRRAKSAVTTRHQRGVSLIEAMLALSIASVLTTAAVPAMRDALVQQRLRGSSSDLHASFHLARSEAIRRGSSVAVAPMAAHDWSTGWRVFADRNDDGMQDADEDTLSASGPSLAASIPARCCRTTRRAACTARADGGSYSAGWY